MATKKLKIPIRAAGAVNEESKLLISAPDLKKRLDSNGKFDLIDCRSETEYRIMHLEGAELATRDLVEEIFKKWDKKRPLVVYDHRGSQAMQAVKALNSREFTNVKALAGGIDSWSQLVDPLIPRY